MAINHTCHAHKCRVPTDPRFFMCARHWKLIPRELQEAIWAAYRAGQERDKRPSAVWMKAAHAAQLFLAEQEYPEDVPGLRKLYGDVDAFCERREAAAYENTLT